MRKRRKRRKGSVMNANDIDVDDFLAKFSPNGVSSCWIWNGAVTGRGYGVLGSNRSNRFLAHRFSYIHFIGDIPDGMYVCHRCDNPLCVNPCHLFLGSPQDNMDDMVRKGRSVRGERVSGAKLREVQVREIKQALLVGAPPAREIAARYGVDVSLIHKIRQGRAWKWLKLGD